MARILALVAIDEPGATREMLEAEVRALSDHAMGPYDATIVGVVKDQHEPLVTFFTGEVG